MPKKRHGSRQPQVSSWSWLSSVFSATPNSEGATAAIRPATEQGQLAAKPRRQRTVLHQERHRSPQLAADGKSLYRRASVIRMGAARPIEA